MRDNLFWFGVRETNCCDIQNILLTTTVRGGTPEVIADLDHTPIAPAADDSRIFWADAYNKDIYVVDTETRLIDKVLSPSAQPVALEVDESSIFFGAADGRIYRADKGGGVIEDLTGTNELPLQLAVYGETVYWTTLSDDGRTGSLLSYALNRGETQELLSGFDFSAGFIVDDGRLMWADNSLRAIMSMDRNGGEAVVIAPRQYDMGYLVQNRFELYFSSLSDSTIRRITKTGTVNDVLAINQDEPGELLVTDDRLYWFNESNGSILFLGL